MFKFCFSDRKEQDFLARQADAARAHFFDVASSYIEKMQRGIAEKADAARIFLSVE